MVFSAIIGLRTSEHGEKDQTIVKLEEKWWRAYTILFRIIAVCKDSYVILACGLTETKKDQDSPNLVTSCHLMLRGHMETGACRQHYPMNNRLISPW